MSSRLEWVLGGLGEGEGLLKTGAEVKSQIVFHTLSIGRVVYLCSRKDLQICYSMSKCCISVQKLPVLFFFCKFLNSS